jgi:hypothetical protein
MFISVEEVKMGEDQPASTSKESARPDFHILYLSRQKLIPKQVH